MKIKLVNTYLQFSSYMDDPTVLALVAKIEAKLSNASSNERALKKLLTALEVSSQNGIWSKMIALYIPCLAATTDAGNVFYNIKADNVASESNSYAIQPKRGVIPTTAGGSLSAQSISLAADNTSCFIICTQRTDQTLGSSSSVATCNGMTLSWKAAGFDIETIGVSPTAHIKTGAISDYANTPETAVLSSVENGNRTLITNEGTTTGAFAITASGNYKLGASSYAALSLFGIADGLTAEEAVTVSNALKTFADEVGIECSNS